MDITKSLFAEQIDNLFPHLQVLIEKINGKRKEAGERERTYLHKTMLRKEYSADQKWESASVNTTYVAADMVSMDSPLPLKKRGSVAAANGILPKVGMEKQLRESQLSAIDIMIARGDKWETIAKKLTDDAVACAVGIDELNERNFLEGLSNGVLLAGTDEGGHNGVRVDYHYLAENGFGVEEKGTISLDDIKRVIAKADADGNTITTIAVALSTYNQMRQSDWAKELVANYDGRVVMPGVRLGTPTASAFDAAIADELNGVTFLKIDRSVRVERNGVETSIKPFNADRLIFLTSNELGAFVWARTAEATRPVAGVNYSFVDEYKMIKKYSVTKPFGEWTSGEALCLPVFENVDQIYYLDRSEAQEVDPVAEGADTTDVKVTIWGVAYNKAAFIEVMKAQGIAIKANATDETIVRTINKLSDEAETALKAAAESAKA